MPAGNLSSKLIRRFHFPHITRLQEHVPIELPNPKIEVFSACQATISNKLGHQFVIHLLLLMHLLRLHNRNSIYHSHIHSFTFSTLLEILETK